MSNYIVQEGDTFEDVSRKQFGSVDFASLIISSNPGSFNPPAPGTNLVISKTIIPEPPKDAVEGVASIIVNGKKFIGWDEIEFIRSMDSFGSFNFRSVWEPQNKEFRDVFRPFQYQSVGIFEGTELLFNGTMLPPRPVTSAKSRTVEVSGYSIPGVINDCTPPISSLPLERDVQDLQQIAKALLDPFGIKVEFDGEPGPTFDREAIEPTQKIFRYLIKLAQQRKLIITDTPEGACKFHTETETGNPVAVINEGDPGISSITPAFREQDYYSHISGQGDAFFALLAGAAGSQYTVVNPRLTGILRPLTFNADDTVIGDIKSAVEAKAGRMFANAVAYTLVIPTWRDANNNLWKPNTTIKITAPDAMIYSSYEFLIRRIIYRRTAKQDIAILTLVIPGVFKGLIPEVMPWDE